MTQLEMPPVAGTLQPGDFKERLSWLAAVNAEYLREQKREGLTVC